MSADNLRLLVTLDCERDYGLGWETPSRLTFDGITRGLPDKLVPLFAEYGIRPTYLLSPEVIASPLCSDVFRGLQNCELGTHLHIEYVVPQIATWDLNDSRIQVRGMQRECSFQLERDKMEVLTELFCQQFERPPRSFRAGRFGIGKNTGKILLDLGYAVDSSVTPHLAWHTVGSEDGPDFREAQQLPYRVSQEGDLCRTGNASLLEIPITILPSDTFPSLDRGYPHWFRPWYSSRHVLDLIVRHMACLPPLPFPRPLVMMFHVMEVEPGCSPYPQTRDQVDQYLSDLRATFGLVSHLGIQSQTLFEYYQEFVQIGSRVE